MLLLMLTTIYIPLYMLQKKEEIASFNRALEHDQQNEKV
ncbi:hypothetical protein LCGC14_2029900 [marine sediment metagenome]|uniref:Uncharacterized protein n=1 Tax=marine sediment metagenome TaxID=412755 RepID=A0A0F9EV08_9ZZZZ